MTEQPDIELSVILPAYNEGEAVPEAIEAHVAALEGCRLKFEIVVVNDASRDDTLQQAERIAANDPRVRILNNEKNLGQAASILRGFEESRGQVLMHNAIDLPFNPEDTSRVMERIRDGADVVVVERINREAYGLLRKVVSWCNIALVKILLQSPFTDHNFTQAYRRRVIEAVEVQSRGVSTVTPELILKARRLGFRVDRIACPYASRRRGKSTITSGKIIHTTAELFRLWAIMRRAQQASPARGLTSCVCGAAPSQSLKSIESRSGD